MDFLGSDTIQIFLADDRYADTDFLELIFGADTAFLPQFTS